MSMFTWWDARGRRLPWLIALVLVLSGVYAATAIAENSASRAAISKAKVRYRQVTHRRALRWNWNCKRPAGHVTWNCKVHMWRGSRAMDFDIRVKNGVARIVGEGAVARVSMRTPTWQEWKKEAEREAARECQARERRSPRVGEWPLQIPIRVCDQWTARADERPCTRTLSNHVAHCWASFTMDYWTVAARRHFHGNVPLYQARGRNSDRRPRIGVNRPVFWGSWWSGSPPT